MIWILISLVLIYLALPELAGKIKFLESNKLSKSVVSSSIKIREQAKRFWKTAVGSLRFPIPDGKLGSIASLVKAKRKILVSVGAALFAVFGWVGLQALLVQNSTPETFAKSFFTAVDSGDFSVLNDSRFFEGVAKDEPVIPQGLDFKVLKPNPSEIGAPAYYLEDANEWRFNFLREKNTSSGYPIVPVDRWNWIFLERDWQVLNLKPQTLDLSESFFNFDASQTVRAGNLEATVGDIQSKKADFSLFKVIPGSFEVSVSPLGFNLGLEKGIVNISRYESRPAPQLSPAPNKLEVKQVGAALKIAEDFVQACLKKAETSEGCGLTAQSSSDDILSSISNDSSDYDIDWEVYDELFSKWESKGCKPIAFQVVSATEGNQQFACSGVNTVATRMSGNNCYRKYSTWLGIYIDGCWGTKTIVETERVGFRSTITVPVKLNLESNAITFGEATGAAAPPKCKPDSYLCG